MNECVSSEFSRDPAVRLRGWKDKWERGTRVRWGNFWELGKRRWRNNIFLKASHWQNQPGKKWQGYSRACRSWLRLPPTSRSAVSYGKRALEFVFVLFGIWLSKSKSNLKSQTCIFSAAYSANTIPLGHVGHVPMASQKCQLNWQNQLQQENVQNGEMGKQSPSCPVSWTCPCDRVMQTWPSGKGW